MSNHLNDVVNVTTNHVSCQGNESPYDHPLVYLRINNDEGSITCPYCSRKFKLIS
jgi:uncharacterized Zn-finger protein